MSDWQPQVVKIEKVEKHPDADTLDVCTVLVDYPVIVKRDEYKMGDLAGYIPIDTIVPDTDQFYFLCPKAYEKYQENGEAKHRQVGMKFPLGSVPEKDRIIKAKKIRGIYSQGMLVSIPSLAYYEGNSIVDALGLKKWEEEEEDNLPGLKRRRANEGRPPKGWSIPKYDIDGIRKYVNCLSMDEEIVLTEKIHGSNAAFSHDGERLWVKSRNFYKLIDAEDMWWDVALRFDFENKMSKFPGFIFFGEIYGQVRKFRYDTEIIGGVLLTKVRFFDVLDVKTKRYLDYDDRVRVISEIGLDPVPELYRGKWKGKEEMYPLAEGMSTLNLKHIREGWVLNTIKERYEPRLDSRMQVKLVGEGYNLTK